MYFESALSLKDNLWLGNIEEKVMAS